jgi:hypothetical protein
MVKVREKTITIILNSRLKIRGVIRNPGSYVVVV